MSTAVDNLNFIAIDFETANRERSSICAAGIVHVENGLVVNKREILIKPSSNYFDDRNIEIHGITPDDVKDAPELIDIWPMLSSLFENHLILAHNAQFDISALKLALDNYGCSLPGMKYGCTSKIAKFVYPELVNHKLVTVAEYLNLDLSHHNSLSDAMACAMIGLNSLPVMDRSKLTFQNDEITSGLYFGSQSSSKAIKTEFAHKRIHKSLLKPNLNADSNNPFYLMKVVFTGTLEEYDRNEAAAIVQELGADVDTAIGKKTDFVVMGSGAGPSKLVKISEMQAAGHHIRILTEVEFTQMLNNYVYGR